MYSFTTRVRYSQADACDRLGLTALLDLFQDCASMHSADSGFSHRVLRERGLMWVLSSWQVEIYNMPELEEEVRVTTLPHDFRGCFGHRNFLLEGAGDRCFAAAETLWTLVSTETMHPARVPDEIPAAYGVDEPLGLERLARHIKPDGEGLVFPEIPVRRYLLDSNGHVNNCQYVRLAQSFVPPELCIKKLRVEYRTPAFEGDLIYPRVYAAENGCTVSLEDAQGSPYAIAEFKGE